MTKGKIHPIFSSCLTALLVATAAVSCNQSQQAKSEARDTATDSSLNRDANSKTESTPDETTDTESSEDTSTDTESSSTATATGTATGGSGAGVDIPALRTSYEGCVAQGKTWKASVNSGLPGCGDTLATWCCTREEVKRRFPSVAAGLEDKFKAYVDDPSTGGRQLYHCSEQNGKIELHFAKIDTRIDYKTVNITQATPVQGGPTDCTKITEDQVFANAVQKGVASSTGTATGTDTSDDDAEVIDE